MRKGFKLLVVGLVFYLVALVVTAPASLVTSRLPPNVSVSGTQGTVWHGTTNRLIVNALNLGQAEWDVNPLYLLVAKLRTNIRLAEADIDGTGWVSLGFNGLQVNDVKATADPSIFYPYLKRNPVLSNIDIGLGGKLYARIDTLQIYKNGPGPAQGELRWQDARLSRPVTLKLGDINADLSSRDDNTFVADLSNNEGALDIGGSFTLGEDWVYNTNVRLAATAATSDNVAKTLPLLGRRAPDGNGVLLQGRGILR